MDEPRCGTDVTDDFPPKYAQPLIGSDWVSRADGRWPRPPGQRLELNLC